MMQISCILCKATDLRAAAVVSIPVALIRTLRMDIVHLFLLSGLLAAMLLAGLLAALLLAGLLTEVLVLLARLILLLLIVHLGSSSFS